MISTVFEYIISTELPIAVRHWESAGGSTSVIYLLMAIDNVKKKLLEMRNGEYDTDKLCYTVL